jgi:hypothetical protein
MTFPGWHDEFDEAGSVHEVMPFPSRPMIRLALAAAILTSLLSFVSMLWQHTASVAAATMAQDMAYGTVKSQVGTTAMALGWAGSSIFTLAALALLLLQLSIRLFDRITED